MIGIKNLEEKGINLQIAKKLCAHLEKEGYTVVMTREKDQGLYGESRNNRKAQDMQKRIRIIKETTPLLTVSIHQNSYEQENVRGAQTFFYTGSVQGQRLAETIQTRLVTGLDPANHRTAKANNSYYLLKKTSKPIAIVECGFLSNPEEAELLADPLYQERVAWQIHMGILQYLHCNGSG